MKQCIDIYTGWIVAFVDGQWRKVHISSGWVTLAHWLSPNNHVGIFTEAEAAKVIGGEAIGGKSIGRSPFALISGPIFDQDVLDRIAFVRFGRVATGEERGAIWEFGDQALKSAILQDLDDSKGVIPDWGRFPLPEMPDRWDRTARSLIIS